MSETCPTGAQLSLWFGRDVPSEMLQAAFGWPSLQGVDLATLRLLPPNTSPVAAEIHALVDAARVGRPAGWTPLRVLVPTRPPSLTSTTSTFTRRRLRSGVVQRSSTP